MKDHHDEYLYTRDHRTSQQVRAGRREAALGWLALIIFTSIVFIAADIFLVDCTSLMASTFGWECKAAVAG